MYRTRGSRVQSRWQSRARVEYRSENIARGTTGQSRLEDISEPDYTSELEDSPDSDDLPEPDELSEPESSDVSSLLECESGVLNTSLDVLPDRSFGGYVAHHWDYRMSRLWTKTCSGFFFGSNMCAWCGIMHIQTYANALRLVKPFRPIPHARENPIMNELCLRKK
jgi:hypothetical protein